MEEAREVFNNLVEKTLEALMLLERITGMSISREKLNRAIYSAVNVILHELSHASIQTVYPELDSIREIDEYLVLCIEEVGARLLEVYVAARIGLPAQSFEEHANELSWFPVFRGRINSRLLEKLYNEMTEAIRRNMFRDFVTGELRDTCRRITMSLGGPRIAGIR
ncbi:hypothetical protein Pyrde_0279 [Pyrodictium delaneyi]|uniref:Uncharacterized protein n=1 Tax=Pyrodictium delaneyi TaxID=1273541 RepID=A0A0N7JCU0_9CREN|nr:hypothetical protein [Pyrodictium delaneyi]ALL00329.1 hypothetical protein Pyrde_0279 [Pyrodictium delaneyi]OWJ54392.1 hypothetical protein Pdsh_07935 [Pyrodictium delaneyi]